MHTLLPNKKYCTKCKSLHFEQTKKCKYCKELEREWRRKSSPEQKARAKAMIAEWRKNNPDRIKQYRKNDRERYKKLKEQGLLSGYTEDRRYNRLVRLLFENSK